MAEQLTLALGLQLSSSLSPSALFAASLPSAPARSANLPLHPTANYVHPPEPAYASSRAHGAQPSRRGQRTPHVPREYVPLPSSSILPLPRTNPSFSGHQQPPRKPCPTSPPHPPSSNPPALHRLCGHLQLESAEYRHRRTRRRRRTSGCRRSRRLGQSMSRRGTAGRRSTTIRPSTSSPGWGEGRGVAMRGRAMFISARGGLIHGGGVTRSERCEVGRRSEREDVLFGRLLDPVVLPPCLVLGSSHMILDVAPAPFRQQPPPLRRRSSALLEPHPRTKRVNSNYLEPTFRVRSNLMSACTFVVHVGATSRPAGTCRTWVRPWCLLVPPLAFREQPG